MRYLRTFSLVLFLTLGLPWSVGATEEVPGQGVAGAAVEEAEEGVFSDVAGEETEYFEDDWLEDEEYLDVQIADPLGCVAE